jgi:hypothetical protein
MRQDKISAFQNGSCRNIRNIRYTKEYVRFTRGLNLQSLMPYIVFSLKSGGKSL